MAYIDCQNCYHGEVCQYRRIYHDTIVACKDWQPTADVSPRSEVTKLEQDVARLEQEKDGLVRKIFEELGDYASDFAGCHIDDDAFLQAIYALRAKYTGGGS